mgnify:CR=1 FL=1
MDGEHYPPVVAAAVRRLRAHHDVRGGIFAGGREKLRAGETGGGTVEALAGLATAIGVPRLDAVEPRAASPHEVLEGVRAALRAARAEVLVDLSDEPVVGYRERFLLMSAALAEGAAYVAADTEVRPQAFVSLEATPSLGVIGTGKRVGKTAVSGWLARRDGPGAAASRRFFTSSLARIDPTCRSTVRWLRKSSSAISRSVLYSDKSRKTSRSRAESLSNAPTGTSSGCRWSRRKASVAASSRDNDAPACLASRMTEASTRSWIEVQAASISRRSGQYGAASIRPR